jgi:hypothetical protein
MASGVNKMRFGLWEVPIQLLYIVLYSLTAEGRVAILGPDVLVGFF